MLSCRCFRYGVPGTPPALAARLGRAGWFQKQLGPGRKAFTQQDDTTLEPVNVNRCHSQEDIEPGVQLCLASGVLSRRVGR